LESSRNPPVVRDLWHEMQTKHSLCHVLSRALIDEPPRVFPQPAQVGSDDEEEEDLGREEEGAGAEDEVVGPLECPHSAQNFTLGTRVAPHSSQNFFWCTRGGGGRRGRSIRLLLNLWRCSCSCWLSWCS